MLGWREINESLDLELEDMSNFIEAVDEDNANSTWRSNVLFQKKRKEYDSCDCGIVEWQTTQ